MHWAFPPTIGGVETHLALLGPEMVREGHQVSLLTGLDPTRSGGAALTQAPQGLTPARFQARSDQGRGWPEKDGASGRSGLLAADGPKGLDGPSGPDGNQQLAGKLHWRGMDIWRSPLVDLNYLSSADMASRSAEIEALIEHFLDEANPDIVHAHNFHYFSPAHAQALANLKKKKGFPLVLTAHNVWADATWEALLAYVDIWDGIIAVSNYIKEALIASGYPAERITVIYHGIDAGKFAPSGPEASLVPSLLPERLAGRRIVFHPARMRLEKGSHLAVQALKSVIRKVPDVLLVLAGTEQAVDWEREHASEVKYVSSLIDDLGLKDYVYVHFIPWDQMPRFYRAAEVCIYPSCFEEPFGLALLEAQAAAKPMIVSRAGGMPEIITDGYNGLVIPKDDSQALASAIEKLLCHPDWARALGQRGHDLVRQRFTVAQMAAGTVDFYRRVLDWAPRAMSFPAAEAGLSEVGFT